ncbi:MAG TPA: PAS domain-containing protein [Sphingomonas sp.]|nr:PAS domain-containing protein [Sphingomonas sp.]
MIERSFLPADSGADPIAPAGAVTAAEIVRNFSAVRQRALGGPVMVTHHGKETHVLCSATLFRALLRRRDAVGEDMVALQIVQLAAWLDQGLILIDADERVVHANPALVCLFPYDPARLAGRRLFDAIPELAGTLAESYLRRGAATRDVRLFEMPSPFRKHAWLQCRQAPVGDGTALLLRDIGPEMRAACQDESPPKLRTGTGISRIP